ncbi:MAG: TetR/AcrR family transcriptional regulator [Hamadaea sp.]|uniref:TetR/AcrR family transcriptional regulator n=1 Tax=Hamadaea sp. NPDC050747 TaxID=3155789 RepID=UPI0017F444F6|nr:TetR/AcrR family transcriptional regulator [Hamadaea sp.]NUT08317.1 TetR/AcrR family transcriptional regulator [Hamadaea sp.]
MTAPAIRSDAARNRGRLLDAAAGLIAERGSDVDVREISRRAEVGMGTLYRHFPTKEALLDAALEHVFTSWAEQATAARTGDAWHDLSSFLGDALTRQTASPGLLDAYCQALPGQPGNTARQHCRQQVGPLIAELVRAAHEAGELRPDVTAEDVSLLLVALGRIAPVVPESTWRRVLQVALDGLRATAATPMPAE